MKGKNLDKFIVATVATEAVIFILVPLLWGLYGTYVHYDPAWPMGLSFLIHLGIGPFINVALGILYALNDKKPVIILAVSVIGNVILACTLLSCIAWYIMFIPVIAFGIAYGIAFLVTILSRRAKVNA